MGDIIFKNKSPTFKNKVYFGRPNLVDRKSLYKKFDQITKNKWLTNDGPFVRLFEKEISKYTGVKHCIAVCNATIGLEILERALNLSGEVILPSMTFVASPNSLLWQGIKPVFCDIEPDTWDIDPAKIVGLITSKTSAIMGVHLFGRPCQVEALKKIARSHNIHLFFDAAHAFGCSHRGTMVGNFGDAEVFSFHATKFFNSIEGGAVVTNNDYLADRLRKIRNFGFSGHDQTALLGINGKMNEFSAAYGLTSFEHLKKVLKTNHQNYLSYAKFLSGIKGVNLIKFNDHEKNNYQYVVLEVDQNITRISRDQIVKILWSENAIVRRYFYPGCHRLEPYHSLYPSADKKLPVTNLINDRLIVLPTGLETGEKTIRLISMLIKYCVQNGEKLRQLFKSDVISDLTGVQDIIMPGLR